MSTPAGGKARKPYTVTRKRETWSEQEHALFVEGVRLFHRDWKKVEAHVRTKTVVQVGGWGGKGGGLSLIHI